MQIPIRSEADELVVFQQICGPQQADQQREQDKLRKLKLRCLHFPCKTRVSTR